LPDTDKQALDVSAYPHLAASLVGIFDSQIGGGKRYDLATIGRRLANATYHNPHASDAAEAITWAMDLTPLVVNPSLSLSEFTVGLMDRFKDDVVARLARVS